MLMFWDALVQAARRRHHKNQISPQLKFFSAENEETEFSSEDKKVFTAK